MLGGADCQNIYQNLTTNNAPIFWGGDGGSAHGLSFYSSAEMLLRGAIKTYAPSTPLAEAFQNDSTVYFALLE